MRELTVDGVAWTVWEVHPAPPGSRGGVTVRAGLLGGWLAVQAPLEKRRIAPIPEHWRSWTDERLADEVSAAAPLPARP